MIEEFFYFMRGMGGRGNCLLDECSLGGLANLQWRNTWSAKGSRHVSASTMFTFQRESLHEKYLDPRRERFMAPSSSWTIDCFLIRFRSTIQTLARLTLKDLNLCLEFGQLFVNVVLALISHDLCCGRAHWTGWHVLDAWMVIVKWNLLSRNGNWRKWNRRHCL